MALGEGLEPPLCAMEDTKIATALPSELSENLVRELESNQRPPGYGPSKLPTALPRDVFDANIVTISYFSTSYGESAYFHLNPPADLRLPPLAHSEI